MTKLVRITGSGFVKQGAITPGHPVESRHWRDVVADIDSELEYAAHQETEEAVVDLWLEDPQSFMDEEVVATPSVRRVTAGLGMTRPTEMHKQAATRNWDQDFSEAQAHVASVLSKLGNGR